MKIRSLAGAIVGLLLLAGTVLAWQSSPSAIPSEEPSSSPAISAPPSEIPSEAPSEQPSAPPSTVPSEQPSTPPSAAPSNPPQPTPEISPPPTDTAPLSENGLLMGLLVTMVLAMFGLAFVGVALIIARRPRV